MSGYGEKEGPDYFGFFKHELEDLFSGETDADQDFLPLRGFERDGIEKEIGENDVNGTNGSGYVGEFGLKNSDILFCDGLGGGLSDYRKERLKGLLKESVSVLTQEVDQMVEVVFATCQLKHRLKSKASASGSQRSASGDNNQAPPSSKRKKSKSPKGYLMRENNFKSLTDILSEKGESCANCKVTETSQWRTSVGSRLCNACGLRLRKGDLQFSLEKKDETIAASQGKADNKNEEVKDDLEFLLDNDRMQVERTMKKYADEISSSLSHMEQQLEEYLDNVTSKCRNMTFYEKQRLWKLIKELPPENLERVVEIIKLSGGSELEQQDKNDLLVDLEDMDDTVLWRLYYYAKAVENARKLLG